jgi:hypothetical protein
VVGRARASEVEVVEHSPWRLVIVGALVLVCCDPATRPAAVVEAPAEDPGFAPASVGDAWTYRTGQTSPGLVMPGATTTDRIVAGAREGGRFVGRVVSEDAGNPAANSERGLIVTPAGVSPDIGTMTTAIGPVTTLRSSGVFLPAQLPAGLRWTWTQTLESPISTMEVRGSAEVIGPEQVTVPAGSFAAVRVRSEVRNHVVTRGGTVPPIEHVQRDDSWYVRGLGLVKAVTTTTGYSAEKVLVAYQVQGAPVGQGSPQIAVGAP